MKTILTLLFFLSVLAQAAEPFAVKTGDNRFSYYVQDDNDPGVFYKSGLTATGAACRPTGLIKIGFLENSDSESIASRYSLELYQSYPGFILYLTPLPKDAMPIAAAIWEEPGVRFAVPLCEQKKRLQ